MRAKDGFSERSDIYTWKNEAVNRNENAFFIQMFLVDRTQRYIIWLATLKHSVRPLLS